MTIECGIPVIDKQGEAKKVLTDYKVHTISIVGEGALGINLIKLKGVTLDTKEEIALKKKIDKAKSLDAAAVVVEEVVTEVVVLETPTEEPTEVVVEDVIEAIEEPVGVEVVIVDEVVAEEAKVAEEAAVESTEGVVADTVDVVEEVLVTEAPVEKEAAKMLTVTEHVEASKVTLDAISKLVADIKSKAPDADSWEVFSIINGICWDLEDAQWYEDEAKWEEIYQQVWEETTNRVEKSKALKVSGESTFEDKCKALELIDPSLAELARTERSKSLQFEAKLKASERAKALDSGAETYKRISTEDNTTDNIVDAMLHIEQFAPEQYAVIAKALKVAANITMAGDLFRDTGSTESQLQMTPAEYVDTKAKSLVESKGGNVEDKAVLAGARAEVRQTAEYSAIYG